MAKDKKNVRNDKKNLEVSKISAIFAPGIASERHFLSPYDAPMIFEKASPTPTPNLVPNEALGLRDMFDRTQRGQRLNVHTRMRTDDCPDNMYRAEYDQDPVTGDVRLKADPYEETFDHVPPSDVNDVVDVLRHGEEIAARKQELQEKRKKDFANAKKSEPAKEPKEKKEPREPEKKEGSEAD